MINNRKNGGKIDFACAAGAHTQQNAGRRGNLMIVSCFNIQTLSSWAPLKNRFSLLLLVVVAVDFQLLIINGRWTVSIERTRTLLLQHYQVELIRGRLFSLLSCPPSSLVGVCVFCAECAELLVLLLARVFGNWITQREVIYNNRREYYYKSYQHDVVYRKKERKESTTSWRCLHLAFLKEEDSRRRVLWQQKDDWPFDYILLWRLLYSFVWAETNQLTSRSYSWTLNACVCHETFSRLCNTNLYRFVLVVWKTVTRRWCLLPCIYRIYLIIIRVHSHTAIEGAVHVITSAAMSMTKKESSGGFSFNVVLLLF